MKNPIPKFLVSRLKFVRQGSNLSGKSGRWRNFFGKSPKGMEMPYMVIPEDSIVPWQQLEVYVSLFRPATVVSEKFHHTANFFETTVAGWNKDTYIIYISIL